MENGAVLSAVGVKDGDRIHLIMMGDGLEPEPEPEEEDQGVVVVVLPSDATVGVASAPKAQDLAM